MVRRNIIETLDAELVVGDADAVFESGKVLVAAANPDLMEGYIEKNDLVITGNRYETQLCAIEMNAGCIIICEGATASLTIRKLAEAKGCTVLSTPHDTYTVARLINQSMPVSYFMIKDKIVKFLTTDFVEEIREVMAKKRIRDFPILDTMGKYRGMISRRNLLDMKKKQVILVDHNEKSQAADGVENTEILEIIDHHRLGTMDTIAPVFFRNQPLGCTATIIYQIYKESGVEISKKIAGLLCSAILSDTLMFRSPTCTPVDKEVAEDLARIAGITIEEYANEMFLAASDLRKKSEEEIFFQDFKKFSSEDVTFGISQITSLNEGELKMLGTRLKPCLEQFRKNQHMDMVFFMATDIIKESTTLYYDGEDVGSILEVLYGCSGTETSIELPGVVSRKKQLVPELIRAIQQI